MGAAACLTTCCLPRHGGDNHKVLPWGETHTASHAAYSNRFIHQGRADDMAKFHARLCQVWLQHETPMSGGAQASGPGMCFSTKCRKFFGKCPGAGCSSPWLRGWTPPQGLKKKSGAIL